MNVPLMRYFALLSEYLRPQSRRVLILAVLLFASVGLQLLNPQILRTFIDTATTQGAQHDLFMAALLFIGVALAHQALSVGAAYVGWRFWNS
jgi:ATP-binding cassette, subfamily B, bacterial